MESSADTTIHFYPRWCRFRDEEKVLYGPGWRVYEDDGGSWVFNNRDCVFARKKDCQAACDALNELNVSYDSLMAMNDDEFGAVIVKYLNW